VNEKPNRVFLGDVLQIEGNLLASGLRRAVALCDRVHRIPAVASFPVIITRSRREEGHYLMTARPRVPVHIAVSRHARHPELTLLHEVGHFLDQMAFNPIGGGFGSECEPRFDVLKDAWLASRVVQRMESLLSRRGGYANQKSRAILRYELYARELWARTYVQWVVKRSADPLFLSELNRMRHEGAIFVGQYYTFQWEDDEFDPIIRLVDDLFHTAGLL